jgi:hypothetical protein
MEPISDDDVQTVGSSRLQAGVTRTMPVVLRRDGFRFFFYSNEGNPLEPPHVHVRRSDAEAKFWLKPDVALARNDGFDATTLRRIAKLVTENKKLLEAAWHEYFAPDSPL